MPDAVPSLSDVISGYQSGLTQHAADVTKKIGEAEDIYKAKIAKADEEESALDTGALKPPDLKPPPQPQSTQPIEVWGSSAMWIAALGGLLTRRPLTNALNAAGAVMNAYRQRDAAAAQQSYDVWKVETENAVKMAQFTLDSYKAALAHIDADKKAAAADFLTTAKALGDENAAYVAEHYGIDAAVRYVDAMQAHVDRMEKAQPGIDLAHQRLQLLSDITTAQTNLKAAMQSGNKDAIAAAQEALRSAFQAVHNFNTVYGKGASGTSPNITMLKSEYENAERNLRTLETAIEKDPKAIKAAQDAVDLAKKRYEEAAQGGAGGDEGGATTGKALSEAEIKARIQKGGVDNAIAKATPGEQKQITDYVDGLVKKAGAALQRKIARDKVKQAFIQDGGTAADFDKYFPIQGH